VDYRPEAGIRIAPHFYTSDDELELAVAAMREIVESGAWRDFTAKGVVT
jgi:kynureninase